MVAILPRPLAKRDFSLASGTGPIVAGVVGGIVVLNLFLLCFCLCRRKRRAKALVEAEKEAKEFDADKSFAALGPPQRRSFSDAPPVPAMPSQFRQMNQGPERSQLRSPLPQIRAVSPISPIQMSAHPSQMQSFGSMVSQGDYYGDSQPRRPEPAMVNGYPDMRKIPHTSPEASSQRMRTPPGGASSRGNAPAIMGTAARLRTPPQGATPRSPIGTAARLRTPPSPGSSQPPRLQTPPQGSSPRMPEARRMPSNSSMRQDNRPMSDILGPLNPQFSKKSISRRNPSADSHALPPSESDYAPTEYAPTEYAPTEYPPTVYLPSQYYPVEDVPMPLPTITRASSVVQRRPSKPSSYSSRKRLSMDTESVYSEATGWGEMSNSPPLPRDSSGSAFPWPPPTGDKPAQGPWAKTNQSQDTSSRIQWKVDSPEGASRHTQNTSDGSSSSRRHLIHAAEQSVPPLPSSVTVVPPTKETKSESKLPRSTPVTASMTADQVAVAALLRKRAQSAQENRKF